MKKVHRKLTEEENSSQSLKVLARDENGLAGIRHVLPKKINERILRQRQQIYFDKRICYLQCFFIFFFLQRPTKERRNRLRDRHGVQFPKCSSVTLASWTLQCSLFWPSKLFQYATFVFTFSETLCYVLLFSWANKTFFFLRLSNDCQIACPVLFSSTPNRKPYNKHLISLLFFVRTLAINRWKQNSVRNF